MSDLPEMHESEVSFWTNPRTKEKNLDYKNCPIGTPVRTSLRLGGWTYKTQGNIEDTLAERERRRIVYLLFR